MIGLMGSMMVMGLKHGQGVAGIGGNIGRVFGMVSVFIGFILVMYMLGNGLVGRAMVVGFIPARMVVGMWGNLSGVLNMVLDTTISGNTFDALPCIMNVIIPVVLG